MRLNADVGEDPRAFVDGTDAQLIGLLDEANIACGGHAGDADTMRATVRHCVAARVRIGAHPSYPDRAGFGRTTLAIDDATLADSVRNQVGALVAIAAAEGARVVHVKPHGALYHDVGDDPRRALAFARWCTAIVPDAVIVLRAGCAGIAALTDAGIAVAREGFADRAARADGSLVPRTQPGALLDEAAALERTRELVAANACDTVCVHGDTPNALAIARAVRAVLGMRT